MLTYICLSSLHDIETATFLNDIMSHNNWYNYILKLVRKSNLVYQTLSDTFYLMRRETHSIAIAVW